MSESRSKKRRTKSPFTIGRGPQIAGRRINYTIAGVRRFQITDAYHFLLSISWFSLLLLAFGGFIVINLIFAGLYLLGGDTIQGAMPGSFWDAFSFSVQTFSTIGYGALTPKTPYANLLMTLESFAGLVAVAIGTGIVFAKFSRASARVTFSRPIVIHERNGVLTLEFRIANERQNEMYSAHFEAYVMVDETTAEGQQLRRSHMLKLEREYVPFYMMTWTSMHQLDETSPLYGITPETVHARLQMLFVHFQATDGVLLQTVRASHVYTASDVHFGKGYADVIERKEDGSMVLHHERLHDVVAIE